MIPERIKIIATIGPATANPDTILALIEAGMSMARLNFSWGTYAEHEQYITWIRQAAEKMGVAIPIIQDISGPRIQSEGGHTFSTEKEILTEKDKESIRAMSRFNLDYIAQSYVADGNDIKHLREFLAEQNINPKIIAKIERTEAIENIDELIAEADVIMIARGDLGDAIPYFTLPYVQKDILKKCVAASTPAIVATDMLSSMLTDPIPSRADVSDIAQAVLDGASITMLSNETAAGTNPIEAVKVMRTIVDEAQHKLIDYN